MLMSLPGGESRVRAQVKKFPYIISQSIFHLPWKAETAKAPGAAKFAKILKLETGVMELRGGASTSLGSAKHSSRNWYSLLGELCATWRLGGFAFPMAK